MYQAELFDQIAGVEDRERTVADQPVRAFRSLSIDVTRHGEDGDAVLGCLECGDQRSARDPSLNNNHRRREPGNDPIPQREPPGVRSAPRGILGHDRSPEFEDLVAETPVLPRIRHVDPATKHGDATATRCDHAAVCCAVDTPGEPGNDGPPCLGDRNTIGIGELEAVGGAPARTDDANAGDGRKLSTNEQQVRPIFESFEVGRIGRLSTPNDSDTESFQLRFPTDSGNGEIAANRFRRLHPPPRDGCDRRRGIAEPVGEIADALRMEPRERQPKAVCIAHNVTLIPSAVSTCAPSTETDPARSAIVHRDPTNPVPASGRELISRRCIRETADGRIGPHQRIEVLSSQLAVEASPFVELAATGRRHPGPDDGRVFTARSRQLRYPQSRQVDLEIESVEQGAGESPFVTCLHRFAALAGLGPVPCEAAGARIRGTDDLNLTWERDRCTLAGNDHTPVLDGGSERIEELRWVLTQLIEE